MYLIIQCTNKNMPNWEGKAWSKLPCKIYSSFDECVDALKGYWINEYVLHDHREIRIRPFTENKIQKLIREGKARW